MLGLIKLKTPILSSREPLSEFLHRKNRSPLLALVLLFFFGIVSCGAETILGLSKNEAADRIKRGDIAFILQSNPTDLGQLKLLSPQAPFYIAFLVQKAGDQERAEALWDLSVQDNDPLIRLQGAKKVVPLLLEPSYAKDTKELRSRNERALAILNRALEGQSQNPDLLALEAETLYKLERYGELKKLYASRKGEPLTMRERALLLIADVRSLGPDADPSGAVKYNGSTLRKALEAFFLDGVVGDDQRWLYQEIKKKPGDLLSMGLNSAILGRLAIADRSYGDALMYFKLTLQSNESLFFIHPETLSDLGKAYQYGGAIKDGMAQFIQWESTLRETPERWKDLGDAEIRELRYRLLFYTGRLKRQTGDKTEAFRYFESALPLTVKTEQRDSCIWYLLDLSRSMDSSLTVLLLEKYLPVWSSPAYFSDFLDNLCGDLVAQGAWSDLLTIFRLIRPVLNGDTLARYAYVLGRAVDLGYLTTDKPLDFLDAPNQGEKQNIARSFYTIAFSADSQGFYYKSLAAARLGESVALVPESSADTGEASENAPQNPRALAFILDFFQYGAGEFALPYAQALANTGSVSELRSIAQAFANNQRFGDSIRFASNLLSRPDHRINRKDLELLYPRPFASIIDTASEQYGMAPELLYGLIRTESAFIPDVVSSAGAIGLTQLMPKTAQDVLARMERAELPTKDSDGSWNLRDPQTNVTLGAWYLRYLIHRTGSPLLALASYNGGVSRVRQWRQGQNQIPEDLFLETITIQETREYGRKVLAAAAVYGYLYYGLTMEAAVADIL